MSKKASNWQGISFYARKFLFGGIRKPTVSKNLSGVSPAEQKYYESMDVNYRWFRQDELVRRCIVINSAYATMTEGFETELEPIGQEFKSDEEKAAFLEQFKYVKEYVDAVNKRVNLDHVLFVAAVKCSIYGKAGFEKILESAEGAPIKLLSLPVSSNIGTRLEPEVNDDWELIGFKFNGRVVYPVEEILYFTNLEIEADHRGISDIEPIISTCKARNYLLEKDFPKITERLWAPFIHMQADTSGFNSEAEARAFLNSLIETAEAGASTAFNREVTSTVVSMNINLAGLVQVCDKFEETIIRNFGTPRFLVNKTPENRACYSADTLTLTEHGWKYYWDITPEMRIATFNPENGLIEYHVPTRLFVYDFEGDMIHFASTQQDILVTPEHKMWFKTDRGKHGHWKKQTAQELFNRKDCSFLTAGDWIGEEKDSVTIPGVLLNSNHQFSKDHTVPMDVYLEFLGYYLSEGGALSPENSEKYKQYTITFAQKDTIKTQKMRECFQRFGFPFSEYQDCEDSGLTRFTFHDKALWTYITSNAKEGAANKRIPRELLTLSKRQLRILFDALILGDGFVDKRKGRNSSSYSTISKQLADDIQEIALRLGLFSKVRVRLDKRGNRKPCYLLSISSNPVKSVTEKRKESYKGKVYCFEVPNHLFVTKRNGCPTIQGNTAYVEFEAFINGPIANKQRYLKRVLESPCWYDWLVKLALKKHGYSGAVPVRIKHVWKPIRSSDLNDVATAVANLYAGGMGILAEFPDIAFEMMGWPKEKLLEWQKRQQQIQPQPQPQPQPEPKPDGEELPGVETVEPDGANKEK